jgi:hypothetical protein
MGVSPSAALAVLVGFVVLLSPFLKPMMAKDRFAGLTPNFREGSLGLVVRTVALERVYERRARLPTLLPFRVLLSALLMTALFCHASSLMLGNP